MEISLKEGTPPSVPEKSLQLNVALHSLYWTLFGWWIVFKKKSRDLFMTKVDFLAETQVLWD